MSGQFVNPIGADLYGLNGLGGIQNPAQRGYLQSRTPVGLDADTFETNKPKKPDRWLFKWFNKNDTFLKASVNSVTAAIGGVGNYFRSMVWSKEEGFFRGLKTAACIAGFGLVASAGFMLAPTLTAASLAGLTAFGVGAGTISFGWNGLKWVGNMMSGKYDRAVDSAHDAAEAATDVATNLTGARQATSAVMRMVDKTPASKNPFNVLKTFSELWETVGNRNFLRNGIAQAKTKVAELRSNVRLYSEHADIVANFELLKTQRQQIDANKVVNTYSKVYDIDGNRIYDNPILNSDKALSYHSSFRVGEGSNTKTYMRVKLEMGPNDAPTSLAKSDRKFSEKYFDILLDDMPKDKDFRLRRNKVKDAAFYENETFQLADKDGFTFRADKQQSEFLLGRMAEGTISLVQNAWGSLKSNFWAPQRQKMSGYNFGDIGGKMAKDGKLRVKAFNPNVTKFDEVKHVQTFTAREMDKAGFYNIPYDGEIQPSLTDRVGGIVKALLGFKDDYGYHPGLFTNPEVLRASNIAKSNYLGDTDEAKMIAQTVTRHHGYLDKPEVFLYEKLSPSGTHFERKYLVRANGNDYIVNYQVPYTGSIDDLGNQYIRNRMETETSKFFRPAIHESETSAASRANSIKNWLLGRSEKNRPVYQIESISANPMDPSRIAVNTFMRTEAQASIDMGRSLTWDSNMVSTGIIGARLGQTAPGKITAHDDEYENDSDEKNASHNSSNNPSVFSDAVYNPFSASHSNYLQTAKILGVNYFQ